MLRRRAWLACEELEPRETPATFGTPWPDGRNLTLSLAPQDTAIGAGASAFDSLDPAARLQVLAAFQAWAAHAGLNIGLVPDSGSRFGTPGAVQGDSRFGDVRVGGLPLNADVLAITTPFNDYDQFSGDVIVNTAAFGPGGPDLRTVMLQEAGHALGVGNSPDLASVMYEYYSGVRTGLSAADISAIQNLYGVRTPDAFEGFAGNDTLGRAVRYTGPLAAELTTADDQDVFKITGGLLVSSISVNLEAKGLSLLTARVEILDSAGRVLKSVSTADPTANDLSLSLGSVRTGATYYIRVSGARNDAFDIGAYNLEIQQRSLLGGLLGVVGGLLDDAGDTLFTAVNLLANTNTVGAATEYGIDGRFDSASDRDVYRIVVPPTAGRSVNLVASVWGSAALNSWIDVFDAAGNKLPFEVLNADGQTTTVQIRNLTPGAAYFISAASDSRTAGNYHLSADLRESVRTFEHGGSSTVSAGVPARSATFTMAQSGQVHAVLTVPGAGFSTVEMIIWSADGTLAARAATRSGRGRSVDVYLPAGTYTVVVRGTALPAPTDFTVGLSVVSDPTGATPTNPTTTPEQPPLPPPDTSTPPPPTPPPSDPPPQSPPTSTSPPLAPPTVPPPDDPDDAWF